MNKAATDQARKFKSDVVALTEATHMEACVASPLGFEHIP